MSIGIFLGIEFGRIFFCLSGAIIDNVGWEFLFYFPGAFSVLVATLYYIFMTDDPLENTWISSAEKTLLAESHKWEYKPSPAPSDSTTSTSSSPAPSAWLHSGGAETDLIGLAAAASTQAYRDVCPQWIRRKAISNFCPLADN